MSDEALSGWLGGIGGFLLGAFIVGMTSAAIAEHCECRRWERQCIARGIGTYDRTGKWQWNDEKPEKP